jgi:hypothetical protein
VALIRAGHLPEQSLLRRGQEGIEYGLFIEVDSRSEGADKLFDSIHG